MCRMKFALKVGTVTGRGHMAYGLNCQDSVASRTFEHNGLAFYAGVVSDGCGEGKRSETGAHLATSFLMRNIELLVGQNIPIKDIPQSLYNRLLKFLKLIADEFQESAGMDAETVTFIKDQLLFTIVGFVIGPEETVIFAAGDGVVVLNDYIDIRDEKNQPMYPAYHLVDRKYLQIATALPIGFAVYTIDTSLLERLAIGTDAWNDELMLLMSFLSDFDTTNVQRVMNAARYKEKRFSDDATVIVVKRQS